MATRAEVKRAVAAQNPGQGVIVFDASGDRLVPVGERRPAKGHGTTMILLGLDPDSLGSVVQMGVGDGG
jgi:hypothetical protein